MRTTLLLASLIPFLGAVAGAQCDPQFRRFDPPGVEILGTTEVPSGTIDLVTGGNGAVYHAYCSTLPGSGANSRQVRSWDGHNWSQTRSMLIGPMLVLQNGDLVACGPLLSGNSVLLQRANGAAWQTVSQVATGGTVRAIVEMANGDLVVGGWFQLNVTTFASVMRWDGASWTPLASATSWPFHGVVSLALGSNGDLYAGGNFPALDNQPITGIARWDGTTWTPLGSGPPIGATVEALAVMPNGDVIAAGDFTTMGGIAANRIARWDGNQWSTLGAGCSDFVQDLAVLPDGSLVAAGLFGVGSSSPYIQRWNGTAWLPVGSGADASVQKLAVAPNGDLYAAGLFRVMGGLTCRHVARWAGGAWHTLGDGFLREGSSSSPVVNATTTDADGDLVVGGAFNRAGGKPLTGMARWDGNEWQSFGILEPANTATVLRLFRSRNGTVFVYGSFQSIDGIACWQSAYRDAAGWHATPNVFIPLLEDANGDVIGTSAGAVVRWDGNLLIPFAPAPPSPLPGGPFSQPPSPSLQTALRMPNGDLLFGGGSPPPNATGFLGRFDGTNWSNLDPISPDRTVASLMLDAAGDLIVGGDFRFIGGQEIHGLARRDASGWHMLGSQAMTCSQLLRLPDGDILAAGEFAIVDPSNPSTLSFSHALRQRGATSSWLDASPSGVNAFAVTLFGGDSLAMATFDDENPSKLTIVTAPCPSTVASLGAACPSSGGDNHLTVATGPWIGGTFTSRGTGLPITAVVAISTGFAQHDAPLNLLLPMAAPACEHRVVMDMLDFQLTGDGTTEWTRTVPDTMALVGIVAYQQMVPLEVDASLNILAASSTNTLQLTIGKAF